MNTRKDQLFKTEMCRNWQEIRQCRYGKKCQYAHGNQEKRSLNRHPKYKTEVCKTFHETGTCTYGVRCTFLHGEQQPILDSICSSNSSLSNSPLMQPIHNNTITPPSFSLFGNNNYNNTSQLFSAFSPFVNSDNTWLFETKDHSSTSDLWGSISSTRFDNIWSTTTATTGLTSFFDRRYSTSSSSNHSTDSSLSFMPF